MCLDGCEKNIYKKSITLSTMAVKRPSWVVVLASNTRPVKHLKRTLYTRATMRLIANSTCNKLSPIQRFGLSHQFLQQRRRTTFRTQSSSRKHKSYTYKVIKKLFSCPKFDEKNKIKKHLKLKTKKK